MKTTDISNEKGLAISVRGQSDSDDNSDLIRQISENLKRARGHWSNWRKQATEDYDFFAGNQWTEEEVAKLKEKGRPPVVFNRIIRTINSVAGVELQNRQEVKYYPRKISIDNDQDAQPQGQMQGQPQPQQQPTTNDSGFSDMLNSAASWVREQNNSEDEESEAFLDCLICGVGFTELRMDYETDPQGMIIKDRIDPLNMVVDPDSTKRNFEDAKWIACVKEFDIKEARKMFPDLVSDDQDLATDDGDFLVHDQTEEWKYIINYSDKLNKINKVKIYQYQYYVVEKSYVVFTPDGNIVNISSKKYKVAQPFIEMMALKVVPTKIRVYKQLFFSGNKIAEKSDLGCEHFTFRAMTGTRDRNNNTYFGLVTIMKDPQRWSNKWLSQIQFILNSNSKGGIIVEEDAVDDIREFEDNWTSPDAVTKLRPGGLGKIQQKQPLNYPDGIDRLLNYAINAINEIPGVNLEMIGMANRDQPIGLEMTRKDAGITVLATFFDSLRRYRKIDGKLLAYYIREYIADGRLIRIIGENGKEYVPLIKDKLAFQYDVYVDDSPTSPNSKDKLFAILMQLIPLAMQAQIPIPPEILDYAPLPNDFVQKWKNLIKLQSQPDPEQQQIQQSMQQIQQLLAQLDIAQKEANIQLTQSQVARNISGAEKDAATAKNETALAMEKTEGMVADRTLKAHESTQTQYREDLSLALNQMMKLLQLRKNMNNSPTGNQGY